MKLSSIPRFRVARRCAVASAMLLLPLTAFAQDFPPTVDLNKKLAMLPDGASIDVVTLDAAGNIYLGGSTPLNLSAATQLGPLGNGDVFVVKLNPTGDQVLYATQIGGGASDTLTSIRVDSAGNAYLIGNTSSQNFPALTLTTPGNPVGGFVAKLNPAGSNLLYSMQLGPRVIPLALDMDATGAVYLAGQANASDLPTTVGVLRPSPLANVDASLYVGFVAKLNAAGNHLDLATYYGDDSKSVDALSLRPNGTLLVLASGKIAVLNATLSQQISSTTTGVTQASLNFDTTGNIYVAGTIDATGLVDGDQSQRIYAIRKFSPDGQTQLLNLPLVAFPAPYRTAMFSTVVPLRFAVAGNGRMYVAGRPLSVNFPTRNATQTCLANIAPPGGSAGVVVSNGAFGSVGDPAVPDYALIILAPDGTTLHSTFISTTLAQPVVSPTNGKVYAAGTQTLFTSPRSTWNGLVRFDPTIIPADKVSPSCLVHSALLDSEPVSPGTLMTVFGSHLGPVTPANFGLDSNGKVPFTVGGASVTVDGKPGAMLYAADTQINFVVPWSTRSDGALVQVCVTYDNATKCFSAATTGAVPGAFPGVSGSAAQNADYSLNTPAGGLGKPVPPGGTVTIYMTGGGLLEGTLVDGGVTAGAPRTKATVTAIQAATAVGCGLFGCPVAHDISCLSGGACTGSDQYSNVKIPYAGGAPGLVSGVTQVNMDIPADLPAGPNQLFVIYFLLPGASTPVAANVRVSVGQ